MTPACPFCGRALDVAGYAEGVIVRLSARCGPCRARIDAAGCTAEDAERDLAERLTARVGNTPADWRITPAKGRRRIPARFGGKG